MRTETRLENLENVVNELKADVAQLKKGITDLRIDVAHIKGVFPYLAKQEDVAAIKSQLPYFATHADINKLLMWMIGVGLTSVISIILGVLNYLK